MDSGVKFVLDNMEKALKVIESNGEYLHLKGKVLAEYNRIKSISYTGNMYQYYLKFKGGKHKYVNDFNFLKNYGIVSNEYMADYLKQNFPNELNHFFTIQDLVVGNKYSNNEIANVFECSYMGGMRRSHKTNSLVLIAKHNNPLYDDQWNNVGIFNYTGMGTIGDQSINFNQNKTLALSKQNGIKVYLFESYKDNEYYYDGEVELYGSIFQAKEIDAKGNLRTVIKFPLKRIDSSKEIVIDYDDVEISLNEKSKSLQNLSPNEIKDKAKSIDYTTISKEVKTTYRERNQYVSEYTKERAKGICDLCGKEAPFKDKNGKPYLESHHVITLAEGGPDAIYNTVAICPNCHRKIHVLKNKNDILLLQNVIYKYLLDDNDIINLKKFEGYFSKTNDKYT